jgi:multidrug efflux pump subunit AcrB
MNKPFHNLSSFSVILTFVFFSLVGLALLPFLRVKLAPSEVLPQLNISYNLYGSSPIVVEKEVTSKLEAMLSRLTGVKKINSNSGNGWGNISIQLDKHVNPATARFEASTIIRQAWSQLPQGLSYPEISLRSSNDNAPKVFLSYSVIAPATPVLIQQYVENRIKNRIAQVEGVYQVNVSGANPMEWLLEFDYMQLSKIGVTTSDIQSAINQYVKTESLGMAKVVSPSQHENFMRVALVADANTVTEISLGAIEIKKTNNRVIRLSDIVKIRKAESQPTGYYRINGLNTIYMTVVANEAINQLELGDKIKELMTEIRTDLPSGYSIETAYDATEYIREELNKIYFRTGLTLLILFLFVFLVYRKLNYLLIIIISLVINLAIAFIFYYFLEVEIQLYSLAGITISLTLIIDNIIVLSDQLIHRRNMKAFLAILAATLTTIGSLVIIFFLEEKMRLNLKDFAIAIMINLAVSLLVSLFLVPALIEKMHIVKPVEKKRRFIQRLRSKPFFSILFSKRLLVYITRFYTAQCQFLYKKRVFVYLFFVLLFGLPVFLLPDKIEKKTDFAKLYNKTIGSEFFKENIKSNAEIALGGTWRLFVQKVYNGSYFNNDREETTLFVNASLPNGSTLPQMNFLIQRMESYISQFKEVKQFETNIFSSNRANISIRFSKKYQNSGFPHQLKSNLISKSLELGGGSWSVYGVGDGFSNDLKESAGSSRATLYGYNYDELYRYAEKFRNQLLEYRRIKEVMINSEYSWYKDDYQEFGFVLDNERIAKAGLEPYQIYAGLRNVFERNNTIGYVFNGSINERIALNSTQSSEYEIWDLQNVPFQCEQTILKLSDVATIEKMQAPQKIAKENQQYKLCVQYEYIGAYEQGSRVHEEAIEAFTKSLPIGYSIKNENDNYGNWGKDAENQYWLLGIVFVIIFFCASILFNSLKQAFYIVSIIPLSFIGVFLTFYWFELNFDSGGFAAFILLSGITVNANIYIIDEYNNILKATTLSPLQAYIKAWNTKIRPLFLTVISTMLGFVPFIVGYREAFWFPLAVGVIGGLVFSVLAIYIVLPLFLNKKYF